MARERKRLYTIKKTIDLDNGTILFQAFGLDDKPLSGYACRIDATKLSGGEAYAGLEGNLRHACMHGINQTVIDTAAQGQGASLGDKFSAMRDRIEHLESGSEDWTGSSRQPGEGTLLFKALCRLYPKVEEETLRVKVTGMKASEQKKMLNSDRLRDIVAELRREANKGVNEDELFEGLDELMEDDETEDEEEEESAQS